MEKYWTDYLVLQCYGAESILLTNASNTVEQHALSLTLFRWSLIMMFFVLWPVLVQAKAKLEQWTEAKKQYWIQQRWSLLLWLSIFEVLICENGIQHFIHWL